ncbi:MAG: sigma-54 specific flagellar transcriptional regulator A [Flavobacteriales bacterium]|jgi:sigma-54 specific flagellar transcriptional regulator A
MLHEKTILVLGDSNVERHDISTILDFIGERALECSYSNWKETLEDSRRSSIGLVVAFISIGETALSEYVESCKNHLGEVPLVAIFSDLELDLNALPKFSSLVARFKGVPHYSELNDAIHRAQCYNEAVLVKNELKNKRPVHLFRSLVGTSRDIQSVRTMMAQVADTNVTVLIEGDSGTGKEVVARNLHYHSDRREGPFVPVNCGAIPGELLESELFGHEKGAFTGAVSSRAGRFELAEGGTLFLDEIGDMPLHMQVKILRVLQEKTFERVGGNKSFKTNVRIIAATHRNLESMIADGKFREDLYYRLNVFPIEMPSLSERSEDVPLLINELVKRMESEERGSIRFNSSAVLSLCKHPWPGNVRELANLVERMAIMHPYGVAGVNDLPPKYRHIVVEDDFKVELEPSDVSTSIVGVGDTLILPEEGLDLKAYIAGIEQNLIQQALDNHSGVVARAAEQLSIRRTTLVEKMRKYGIQR